MQRTNQALIIPPKKSTAEDELTNFKNTLRVNSREHREMDSRMRPDFYPSCLYLRYSTQTLAEKKYLLKSASFISLKFQSNPNALKWIFKTSHKSIFTKIIKIRIRSYLSNLLIPF